MRGRSNNSFGGTRGKKTRMTTNRLGPKPTTVPKALPAMVFRYSFILLSFMALAVVPITGNKSVASIVSIQQHPVSGGSDETGRHPYALRRRLEQQQIGSQGDSTTSNTSSGSSSNNGRNNNSPTGDNTKTTPHPTTTQLVWNKVSSAVDVQSFPTWLLITLAGGILIVLIISTYCCVRLCCWRRCCGKNHEDKNKEEDASNSKGTELDEAIAEAAGANLAAEVEVMNCNHSRAGDDVSEITFNTWEMEQNGFHHNQYEQMKYPYDARVLMNQQQHIMAMQLRQQQMAWRRHQQEELERKQRLLNNPHGVAAASQQASDDGSASVSRAESFFRGLSDDPVQSISRSHSTLADSGIIDPEEEEIEVDAVSESFSRSQPPSYRMSSTASLPSPPPPPAACALSATPLSNLSKSVQNPSKLSHLASI